MKPVFFQLMLPGFLLSDLTNFMSIFLVDYENVSASGLDGLEKLTEEDVVYIFYTENADRLTFDAHRRLLESRAAVRYYKVESGTKNALDFQLVSFLGYLIRENGSSAYYIISKDNGFDSVLHFWTKQNTKVMRLPKLDVENTCQEHEELLSKLKELMLDEADVKVILGMIQKYKTKQGLNNALMKQFDNKKTSEIYRVIKPYIANKKGH